MKFCIADIPPHYVELGCVIGKYYLPFEMGSECLTAGSMYKNIVIMWNKITTYLGNKVN